MIQDDQLIKQLYDNFHIFPANRDKSPACQWADFRNKKIPFEKLSDCAAYGLICGVDGVEVIDIDNHFNDASELYSLVTDNVSEDIFNKITVISTQSGGFHLYYKCENPDRNQKLASRINDKGRPETLIETRGTGGYVLCPPTKGYNLLKGSFDLESLTTNERDEIIEICRALNEVVDENKKARIELKEGPGQKYIEDNSSPYETIELLKKHGWTSRDGRHFTRPGKKTGISATFGKVGLNKFYCFTSNGSPFQQSDMAGSYTMFGVLAELEYNGDYSACAKDLSKKYNQVQPENVKVKEQKKKESM